MTRLAATFVTTFADALETCGVESPLLRARLQAGEAWIPALVVGLAAIEAERAAGPDVGVRAGLAAPVGSLDLAHHASCSAATLGDAIDAFNRYVALLSEVARYRIAQPSGDTVAWQLAYSLAVPRALADFCLVAILGTLTRSCPGLAPFRVALAGENRQRALVPAGVVDAVAAEHDAVLLSASALEMPLATANAGLHRMLDRFAAEAIADQPRSLADRTREAIRDLLTSGDASAERVAERLRVSRRTLARHLKAEGTSHRELLDDTRRLLAARWLPRYTVAEVATRLAFADVRSFRRAFRRWNGTTPRGTKTV